MKTNVLDAERYAEKLKKAKKANLAARQKIEESKQLKEQTKHDLNKCRLELAMPGGAQGKPKINKDTKVRETETEKERKIQKEISTSAE